jgi:hypothetical protein
LGICVFLASSLELPYNRSVARAGLPCVANQQSEHTLTKGRLCEASCVWLSQLLVQVVRGSWNCLSLMFGPMHRTQSLIVSLQVVAHSRMSSRAYQHRLSDTVASKFVRLLELSCGVWFELSVRICSHHAWPRCLSIRIALLTLVAHHGIGIHRRGYDQSRPQRRPPQSTRSRMTRMSLPPSGMTAQSPHLRFHLLLSLRLQRLQTSTSTPEGQYGQFRQGAQAAQEAAGMIRAAALPAAAQPNRV